MSKKPLIIIISVILGFFLIALVGYYLVIQNRGDTGSGENSGIFRNFFPFGGTGSPVVTPGEGEPLQPEPSDVQNFTKKLRKISIEPVAGAGTLDVKVGTIVRYIEKATGHIYETELFSPKNDRISNTTIPLVYEAFWGNKNNSIITQYLEEDNVTVNTYSLTVKGVSTTTENTISGVQFPKNISDISIFGNSVFHLQQNDTSSVGYISQFDGSKRKEIWNSPLHQVTPQYINEKTIALTTRPEQNIPGFLYFVNTSSGQTRRVIGDIFGLTTLVNDLGTQVLYLTNGRDAQMFVFDDKNKSYSVITPTTFPEKCVWSKKDRNILFCAVPREFISGSSLISWYKGLTSWTDDIWKYDIKNNTSSIVGNLFDESGESIDVIKPILSENEQYLVFINKIDNTLWNLDLMK